MPRSNEIENLDQHAEEQDVAAIPMADPVPHAIPVADRTSAVRLSAPLNPVERVGPPLAEDRENRRDGSLAVTPIRLLRALRRRWYLAIPAAILAAVVAGYLATMVIRSDYTARTQVFVSVNQPVILFDTPEGRADLGTYQRRQAALVRSRPVLHAALERPGVSNLELIRQSSDPVGWLEKELKTDFSASPEILRITLNGPDPAELIILLDAIREAYLQEGVNKEVTDKTAALGRLERYIEEERANLEKERAAISKKAQEFDEPDVHAVRARHETNVTKKGNHETYLFQLEVQVAGWEQTRRDLESRPPEPTTLTMIRPADQKAATELALAKDTVALAARADVERLTSELAANLKVAADGNRNKKVVDKEKELAQAKERLAAREQVVREDVAVRLSADAGRDIEFQNREHQTRIRELQSQIERTRGQMQTIRAEIERLKNVTMMEARGLGELNLLAGRMAEIDDRIKVAKSRARTLEIELKAPPRAHTDAAAVITHSPNPERRFRMVAAAVVIGFFGALCGVAYLDLRSGRIDSPEGVDRQLGTGVVGFIPRVSSSALAAVVHPGDRPPGPAERAVCDAADACRTLLLPALASGGPKVIMVTSPTAREGKTTLAAQLALSLGRAGYRTLLIDGDVRQPGVHTAFHLPLGPGLTDVLRKTSSLQTVFQKSPFPTLLTIPAGQCGPEEAVPLLQHRMRSLLKRCKAYFEVILIDTPPLLHLPDAMVIGRHADGAILSLMNDVSTLPAARATCDRLRTMNLPVLGAVLNGARVRGPRGY